jgi:peptidoglycan/xylan/chitin deacetylase (PgdA/CDA1 family)/TolA-binding protein
MRVPLRFAIAVGLFFALACSIPASQDTSQSIPATMDEAVASYRQIIVLMDHSDALDEGNRQRVRTAAWIIFEENRERLDKLDTTFHTSLDHNDAQPTEIFLARLESSSDYRDADKLVFRDILDGLSTLSPQQLPNPTLHKRIADDVAAITKIQNLYQKEVAQIFGDLQTRAMPVHREAWEHYLAFLHTKYQREQILRQYASQLPPAESRGGASPRAAFETFGTELPPNTFVLTFDDGPHPRYTDQVLAILKTYNLHAVFFEVGKNLGTVNDKNEVTLGPTSAASYRVLQSGSVIANHSYSHPVLPKLDEAAYTKEINSTNTLLTYIGKSAPVLFRPPYGATNDAILTQVHGDNMRTIIWNIDSEDWADPVPNSVVQRVLTEAHKQKRGIILFHDIHKVGLEALPNIITTLQSEGAQFASWDGSSFSVPNATRGDQPPTATPAPAFVSPYRESWAAIIGIDDYTNWQKLRYATHDAQGMKDLLLQKYNFKPDHIFTLLDGQATRQNILSLLGDKLANPDLVQHDDRVLIFFAGHGATRKLASGRDLGYIIPVDADLFNFEGSAISMTNFQDISEAIPAKHVLFLMDSCYSGLALTRSGGLVLATQNYLNEMARREARQMFTAGGADQQVADNGPNGHSVFTWTLLQGLDGRADLNGDGVISATELAAYVAPAVSALSHQTPAFGNLPGSEGGDFLFDWKHDTEFLNADSAQLPDDGIKVNAELEQLRAQMKQELRKNEELRKQLEAAQLQLKQGIQTSAGTPTASTSATPAAASANSAGQPALVAAAGSPAQPGNAAGTTTATPPALTTDAASALNDEGMRLYKEKRYPEAAAKFAEASKLQPAIALFANNAGFAYYRMNQYDQAIAWFQQTIVLDPKRAVAYLNLGDAFVALNKKPEARDAYEKYLQLAPNSKSAPTVREKLNSL